MKSLRVLGLVVVLSVGAQAMASEGVASVPSAPVVSTPVVPSPVVSSVPEIVVPAPVEAPTPVAAVAPVVEAVEQGGLWGNISRGAKLFWNEDCKPWLNDIAQSKVGRFVTKNSVLLKAVAVALVGTGILVGGFFSVKSLMGWIAKRKEEEAETKRKEDQRIADEKWAEYVKERGY